MKKNVIGIILTLALCAGFAGTAMAVEVTPFGYSNQNGSSIRQIAANANLAGAENSANVTESNPLSGAAVWALNELNYALYNDLILDSMIGKWPQPANRLDAAEAVVRLLEAITGKTMDAIAVENEYDLTDCFIDTTSEYANFLKRSGISNGVDGTRFNPEGIFTRAQMVTMLGRMAKGFLGVDIADFPKGSKFFSDVPDWADEFVGWAGVTGITEGVGGGRFDSNGVLQNQHTGVFMWRAFAHYYKSPYELLRTNEQITVEQMDKLKKEAASWQAAIAGIGNFAEFIAIEPSDGSGQQVYLAFRRFDPEIEKYVYIDGFERLKVRMPDGVEARICTAGSGGGSCELTVGFRFISGDTERIELFHGTMLFYEYDTWENETIYQQEYLQWLSEQPLAERQFK